MGLLIIPPSTAWSQEDSLEEEVDDSIDADPEVDDSSYYDHTGWYVKGGVVAGFFDAHKKKVDLDPGVGFSVALGVRHSALVGGEINFSYIYESKTKDFDELVDGARDNSRSVKEYEVLFDLHTYPFSAIEVEIIPDWVQPFVATGVGFGEVEAGSQKQMRLLLRFGGGVDVLITETLGVYLDGGYSVITAVTQSNKKTILDGRGQIGFGVLARF